MVGLEVGLEATRGLVVESAALYSPTGREEHSVLSSPAMFMEMELASVDAVRDRLADGDATVGFHLDVKHLAPAPAGARIETTARLIEIAGKKLKFQVDAYCGTVHIGTGTHRRAIVSFNRICSL
ncbi:MAG: dihydrolipoamide acyltransferase [Dehalococcoidia bacterium]|jgi:predicted thioesterase|nr:dihydrolipoamide acyltransferase [Dehalococcoidia bacterium]